MCRLLTVLVCLITGIGISFGHRTTRQDVLDPAIWSQAATGVQIAHHGQSAIVTRPVQPALAPPIRLAPPPAAHRHAGFQATVLHGAVGARPRLDLSRDTYAGLAPARRGYEATGPPHEMAGVSYPNFFVAQQV